jgi:glycosyltransferase involved in cell wall biosynthesis
MSSVRRITVIAPARDEAAHVDAFVVDLARQDFDGELQVLVADGNSTDGTPALLLAAAARERIDLRVLPNPEGWVSPGLNRCIAEANGDLIVRFDCHSRYPPDYLRRCAELSEGSGAWNVGGQVVPEGETPMERAVAVAMDSPFGGIGWTRVAGEGRPRETDTVTFGAFRPEAFERAGLFDEELVRNQDDEFNLRLRRAGGRIVIDPAIVVRYRPRGSLRGVWRQYYEYGYWKPAVMRKHGTVLSARSLAPIGFVASLAGLLLAAPASRSARKALVLELGVYLAGAFGFGVRGLARRQERLALLPRVVATFAAFHLGYGVGMARGLRAKRPR